MELEEARSLLEVDASSDATAIHRAYSQAIEAAKADPERLQRVHEAYELAAQFALSPSAPRPMPEVLPRTEPIAEPPTPPKRHSASALAAILSIAGLALIFFVLRACSRIPPSSDRERTDDPDVLLVCESSEMACPHAERLVQAIEDDDCAIGHWPASQLRERIAPESPVPPSVATRSAIERLLARYDRRCEAR